jgi:ATP-dependent RNA helicase DeaD
MEGIDEKLSQEVIAAGYTTLTPIQLESIKLGLAGEDLIARAPTGTGKTAAFLIPILNRALMDRQLLAVVVEPSRELAIQAANECRKLSGALPVRAVAAYGGTPATRQSELIKAGAQVIIGTPGRLRELVQSGVLKPSLVKILVLDEADRLMGEQFIKDVTHMASRIGKDRQTMLFCVQMPAYTLEHAKKFLKPVFAQVKVGVVSTATVKHSYIITKDKTRVLAKLLSSKNKVKSVVFCSTATAARGLVKDLRYHGVRPILLHSQLDSSERNDAVRRFAQEEDHGVLIATDLAARGMHFEGVKRVYSFDLPAQPDFYLHRAGRTGRMGHSGECISLVEENETGKLKQILSAFGITATQQNPPSK